MALSRARERRVVDRPAGTIISLRPEEKGTSLLVSSIATLDDPLGNGGAGDADESMGTNGEFDFEGEAGEAEGKAGIVEDEPSTEVAASGGGFVAQEENGSVS